MSSASPSWSPTSAPRRHFPWAPTGAGERTAKSVLLLRLGLGLLFLVNALVAWIDPAQFVSLVTASGAARLVDPELVVWMIRANDLALGLLILFAFDRWPRLIPAWAGLYLASVAVVKAAAL